MISTKAMIAAYEPAFAGTHLQIPPGGIKPEVLILMFTRNSDIPSGDVWPCIRTPPEVIYLECKTLI